MRRIDILRKPHAGNWGAPPYHRFRERRFGSDILWKTGRELSARSVELGTTLAEPVPCSSSCAGFREHTHRYVDTVRAHRSRLVYVYSGLCLILRPPRVAAFRDWSWSSASLDQCLLYRTLSREIFFRNMEIVAVIPARFASTRLPGKALLSETGRPLILHVIEAARRAKSLQRIIVATDDARIARAVTSFGGEVMMTRADHPTGTDRVAEVAARLDQARVIVNLQGDEPEISGHALDLVVELLENDAEAR